jgi:GDPmannose 4,6-dehydratase
MTNRKWIDKLEGIKLLYGDLLDGTNIESIMERVKPNEIYNLAAQSHVAISFQIPEYTANVNGLGVIRLLEAMRKHVPFARFYQASTSEMFGKHYDEADEQAPFSVSSPYATSKLFAHNICEIYREAYNLFICCGILFNHESPRRGENFVTRKITKNLVDMSVFRISQFELGNLDSKRDWGFAGDYVEAMWLMLQQDKPDDYVIATGKVHTVKEFVEESCEILGLTIEWNGRKGLQEIGTVYEREVEIGRIVVNPKYYRPIDVTFLKGNSQKAEKVLGWKPKTSFKELVELMVRSDLSALHKEKV